MNALKPTSIRSASVAAIVALIVVLLAWSLSTGTSSIRLGFAAVITLPLVAFLPALVRSRRRGYAALTLCLVPYLVGALTELVANPGARTWAAVTLLLAFTLFVLAIVFLRLTRSVASVDAPSG